MPVGYGTSPGTCSITTKKIITDLTAHFLPGEVLCLEAEHVHLCVGVSHVAYDAAVLHLVHVVPRHHVLVTRCRDHNIHLKDGQEL